MRRTLAARAVAIILSIAALAACGGGAEVSDASRGRRVVRHSCHRGLPGRPRCQAGVEGVSGRWLQSQPTRPCGLPRGPGMAGGRGRAPHSRPGSIGLAALGQPPSGQQAWSEVLSAIDTIVHLNADQIRAARSVETQEFVEATAGLHAVQSELERATEAAGVPMCADVHK